MDEAELFGSCSSPSTEGTGTQDFLSKQKDVLAVRTFTWSLRYP